VPAPDVPAPATQSRPATTPPLTTLTAPTAMVTASAAALPVLLMLMTRPFPTRTTATASMLEGTSLDLSSVEHATDFFQDS
jgi:hypothetical protein